MSDSLHQILTLEQEAASPNTSLERLQELAYQSEHLALLVAQNPHTPAELLEKLAEIYQKDFFTGRYTDFLTSEQWYYEPNPRYNLNIMQALVKNINTSTEALLLLGEYFPQEMLAHPMFNLSLLEDPTLVMNIPINTIISLLSLEIIPSFLQQWISRSQTSDQNAIEQITPIFILKSLTQNADDWIRCIVAKNPHIPISILEVLAQDAAREVRFQVARNPNTTISVLEVFAQDNDEAKRVRETAKEQLNCKSNSAK